MKTFSLAMGQMRVAGGEVAGNMARAVAFIGRAAAGGAALVVLPEVLDCGWCDESARLAAEPLAERGANPNLAMLCDSAVAGEIHVCAGLTERDGDVIYNSAVLIDPAGRVLLRHRKINQLELETVLYGAGTTAEAVCDTALGRLGLMICADAFAPREWITHALADAGAQLVVSPCAWAVPPDHDQARDPYGALWRDVYGRVARQRRLWIAGVSNVGTIRHGEWAGHHCIGCSMLVGPDGEVHASGPYGTDAEEILSHRIPLAR
jgi:predicted amidohydrolase